MGILNNPSKVNRPNLSSPIGSPKEIRDRINNGNGHRHKREKGNEPYLAFRRKLRKEMF